MDYTSALRYVLGLADLERMVEPPGARPRYDLGRMHALLDALGRPHLSTPTVHVTGTKGKGSTSAMVASILRASGFSVGLYTSPHLHTMRERVQVNGAPLSEEDFAATLEAVWPSVEALSGEGVTTFETLTAMAFHAFAERRLDWQVLEVGMGGTLDATNTVESPQVCVITSISLDHTKILGDTVEAIARDKAGIIKPGATVVTAPQPPGVIAVLREACDAAGAELVQTAERYDWRVTGFDLRGQSFHVEGPKGAWEWLDSPSGRAPSRERHLRHRGGGGAGRARRRGAARRRAAWTRRGVMAGAAGGAARAAPGGSRRRAQPLLGGKARAGR